MKKKMGWFIGIILIGLTLFIGGKIYFSYQSEQKQEDLIETEKQSVSVLKNTFTDIKKIEFEKTSKNNRTGSYHMFIKMMNKKGESVNFTYSFWKEINEIGSYGIENDNLQKEGITTTKIQVTLSNGEEIKY